MSDNFYSNEGEIYEEVSCNVNIMKFKQNESYESQNR